MALLLPLPLEGRWEQARAEKRSPAEIEMTGMVLGRSEVNEEPIVTDLEPQLSNFHDCPSPRRHLCPLSETKRGKPATREEEIALSTARGEPVELNAT